MAREQVRYAFRAAPLALHYVQAVPPDGFEWTHHELTGKLLLRPVFSPRGWSRYAPLIDRPLLCRQFAEIDKGAAPTPQRILKFAADYGSLGIDQGMSQRLLNLVE